jgi:hypothetical protein
MMTEKGRQEHTAESRQRKREDEGERAKQQPADKQDAAERQMTPEAEPDDTIEGEGSPGLTIMGGGGHA